MLSTRTTILQTAKNRYALRKNIDISVLIGNYREQLEGVEEDLDMPDVDPHVVSVIAGIEERALAVLERRYANPVEGAWVTWVTDRMLMRIKQIRPKLQALIAEMETRIEPEGRGME